MVRRTQLYDYHKEHGKLTEFSGFEMPLWYSSIIDEHLAVRNAAGLFDVSHMGRVFIKGKEASEFLSYLLPTNCVKIGNGRAYYSTICNDEGGIIDDVITNKFSPNEFYMVINAGNREKDLSWIRNLSEKFDVSIDDISENSALFAFQGPISIELLQRITETRLSELKRFHFKEARVSGERCLVSRTGYTGEDGYEITFLEAAGSESVLKVWQSILESGKEKGVLPCGLGSRDSLRLEAGMCLYGQDIDEKSSPIEASLENVVDIDGREFSGRTALENQMKSGVTRKRIAFTMIDSGIPRHAYGVAFSGKSVGIVTSGTFSPVLKIGIGLAYVQTGLAKIGQKIMIEMRGQEKMAEIVPVPFYDTTKYGYRRKK